MEKELPQRQSLPHSTPAWVASGSVYFITICAEPRGVDQLCNEAASDCIFASIEFNMARGILWPHLLLLMPDHVHGLISFAADPGMRKATADWKHYVSREAGIEWQRDFFDHRLRNDEGFEEKAAYIRQNPVRAGLIGKADDWPYVRSWAVSGAQGIQPSLLQSYGGQAARPTLEWLNWVGRSVP
jgi:putative transposase